MKFATTLLCLCLTTAALAAGPKCQKEAEAAAFEQNRIDYNVSINVMFSTLVSSRGHDYVYDVNLTDGTNYKVEISKIQNNCKVIRVYEDANG